MEIKNEKELETGEYEFEVELTPDELETLKAHAKNMGRKIEEMSLDEIIQFSVVDIIEKQMERE